MRTVQQDLTFDEAAIAFKRYKVIFQRTSVLRWGFGTSTMTSTPIWRCFCPTSANTRRKSRCSTMNPVQSSGTARSLAARSSSSLKTRSIIWRCATGQSLPSRVSSARISRTIPRKPSAKRCSMRWCIGTTASAAALSST